MATAHSHSVAKMATDRPLLQTTWMRWWMYGRMGGWMCARTDAQTDMRTDARTNLHECDGALADRAVLAAMPCCAFLLQHINGDAAFEVNRHFEGDIRETRYQRDPAKGTPIGHRDTRAVEFWMRADHQNFTAGLNARLRAARARQA